MPSSQYVVNRQIGDILVCSMTLGIPMSIITIDNLPEITMLVVILGQPMITFVAVKFSTVYLGSSAFKGLTNYITIMAREITR